MKKEIILEFEDVTKYYGDELVFNNINIKIRKGDVVALTGKNGCGKSTLLKCINRLEKIDNGTIMFKGLDVREISMVELRQKIGIVFQDYNLFQHLTVLDNLTIGLTKIKKYSKEESFRRALNILKKIGLTDKKYKYPDELSGGQKQRVAIARTLLMEPDIILLDEPTSALDTEMKDGVLNLIKEIVFDDMTIIIVSHEDEFVKNIADKVYTFKNHSLELR